MDAISEALAAGHKIVFNTGRPLSGFLPILKELGLDREGCYAIAFNGGLDLRLCCAKRCTAARFRSNMHASFSKKTQEAGLYCHTYSDTSLSAAMWARKRVFTRRQSIPVVEDPLAGTPRQGAVQDDRD